MGRRDIQRLGVCVEDYTSLPTVANREVSRLSNYRSSNSTGDLPTAGYTDLTPNINTVALASVKCFEQVLKPGPVNDPLPAPQGTTCKQLAPLRPRHLARRI